MKLKYKVVTLLLIIFLCIMPYLLIFQPERFFIANNSDFNLNINAEPIEIDGNYWLE